MILERDVSPGSFFKQYPRHRQLISINKRFAGQTSKEFHMRVKSACGGGRGRGPPSARARGAGGEGGGGDFHSTVLTAEFLPRSTIGTRC